MDRHLDAIDGLRGIAIALVVAYHSWLVYGADSGLLSQAGFLGVELFFALSGFCMFYPFARARFLGTALPSWSSYAYRRAVKIVPSYLLALTVFALAYAHRDGTGATALAYAAHALFLHPFVPSLFQSISGPLWTIGVEVQFYAIFPLLCGLFLRQPAVGALVTVAVAVGYRAIVSATHADPGFFLSNQVVAFLDLFAAGMTAAYVVAWAHARPPGWKIPLPATIAAAVAIGLGIAGMAAFTHSGAMNDTNAFYQWQLQWRPAIAVLLFVMVAATTLGLPKFRKAIANPATAFLAVISYNLYLWHLEILSFFNNERVALPLALLAAVVVASAVTYCLERPLLTARRIRPRAARQQSVQTA